MFDRNNQGIYCKYNLRKSAKGGGTDNLLFAAYFENDIDDDGAEGDDQR